MSWYYECTKGMPFCPEKPLEYTLCRGDLNKTLIEFYIERSHGMILVHVLEYDETPDNRDVFKLCDFINDKLAKIFGFDSFCELDPEECITPEIYADFLFNAWADFEDESFRIVLDM